MYLKEMIESILQQTYSNWELWLVDAGSEDGSLSICQKYASEYDNIFVERAAHQPPGITRNIGIEKANGDYICFVDADDYLPNSQIFELYIQCGMKEKKDIITSNYERLWKGRLLPAASHEQFSDYKQDTEEFRFRGFFSVGTLSYVWNKLYSKAFLERHKIFFSDVNYGEDKLFNIQCYLSGATYAFLSESGYVYRKNENSVSHKYEKDRSEGWICIANQINAVAQTHLADYTIFFAAFFDAKMEYIYHEKSLYAVNDLLKKYGENPVARKCFSNLWRDKKKNLPEQMMWRLMIRGFSFFMNVKCYLLLALGIKILIDRGVDERLSDTGKRE